MADIIQELDPLTIAAVIEANIIAYLLSFARLPGATLHDDRQVVWVDSGIADPGFNSVVYANLSPDAVDARIEAVLSHFRRRSLPVTWHIGPSTQPADLDRYLLAHGMAHSEDEPGMALEIDRMRDDFSAPSGLTMEPVRDVSDLQTWISVWGCGAPDDVCRLWLDAFRWMGLGDDLPWRYFLGRLNGKPVATAKLFVGAGVAAVHHVVTLPEMRRRGIGTAMTLRVLHDARDGLSSGSADSLAGWNRELPAHWLSGVLLVSEVWLNMASASS